jgi:Xaa-Pro aminopeptidase
MDYKNRLERLRHILKEKSVDAILVSQPDNLFYLTGCEGLEGYLLVTGRQSTIITDFRYVEQAGRRSPDWEIFRISGKMADWFPELFTGNNIQHLGFESHHLSFSAYEQVSGILKNVQSSIDLVPVNGLVESLRVVKEKEEIEHISRAAKITDSTLGYVANILRAGMTENQLAWEIEKYMRENGSQTVPFEIIVAAGPNSALPHAKPSDYVIKPGEPIVIDIGSKYEYYGSDLTRTFVLGDPDDTFRKVYGTVLQAQLTAISKIKAGMTGAEADAVARSIITRAGYGEAFGHSLGHGIGLVTHENPRLGLNSMDLLTNGMVFTIEPGIYVSGWGGVRIEDDVVMEDSRLKVISNAKK